MIVRRHAATAAATRSGFTLLEVLVVVAILVVLAGVSSIFVFKYLEDAKVDKATLDMQALTTAFESFMVKNGNIEPQGMEELVPFLKQGQDALYDPWGNPYQYRIIETEVGPRVQFFTAAPDGAEVSWPKN